MVPQRLEEVRAKLALGTHEAAQLPEGGKLAAVAAILREAPSGLEMLLIRRADVPGDPWSGHMAFPGGRASPVDVDLEATARRETLEELGLDLGARGERLGRLDDVPAIARGRHMGLVVAPFVFGVTDVGVLRPNAAEVADVVWTPLAPLVTGAASARMPYVHEGQRLDFPGFRVGEHVVWGLTYKMLMVLFARLR